MASTAPGLISRTTGYLRASGFFDEGGTVDAYLAFEAALAEVEGDLGVIPEEAVAPIVSVCRRDLIDMDALRNGAVAVGYPIVPLVSMLAELAGEHGQWVHYGTTTQDVMDTAQVLQIRGALTGIFSDMQDVEGFLAALCQDHKDTAMAGRSKLQHGVPISFGYKSAVWLDQIQRTREGVQRALDDASMLQFGGAIGTLASLQGAGLSVRSALAKRLDLHEPIISWHVSRDRTAMLATAVASLLGALAKMAVDIALMMSTEVQELQEPAAKGRGSSSTMPQKRNPVMCEAIIEAAREVQHVPSIILDAMLQEHERGIGHGYRERTAICNAICLLSGAVTLAKDLLTGLKVDTARMQRNLGATKGLIQSEAVMIYLSERFGRIKAHDILHEVSHQVILKKSDLETELARLGLEVPPAILAEDAQIAHAYGMIDQVLCKRRLPAL
ncbi:adenylosuccinate lyase family protein [Sulfitobacter sp. DSM 110093]|uniref:class-II fumarase/aspartase family protein n=1 Tax=Sulfitobacter sp. DSM 110093 TaxID=2883127 RepID=UPI001FAD717D|nr:adenylosuccinate lyase family protein [Sulfitobacter sp. DSM 110093]